MRVPFKIFPSFGYKNSQFQAVTTVPGLEIQIEGPGGQVLTVRPSEDQPATLTKLTEPGNYRAHATSNGQLHEQHFQVLDGIRIGSSVLKSSYVFDQVPYAFFLMRDRMLIHQDTTGTVWEENVSPSAIVQLDTNLLLFKTDLGADPETRLTITNFGIYSLDSFSIVAELMDHYVLIWFDKPRKRIWLYSLTERQIMCLSTQATNGAFWQKLLSVPAEPDCKLQPGNAQLFAKSDKTIVIIDTKKLQITSITLQPDLAVDDTGTCYKLIGRALHLVKPDGPSPAAPLFEVPATASLQTQSFYFVGAAFQLSAGPTDFDRRLATATALLEPVAVRERKPVVFSAPVVCNNEAVACTVLPAPSGLYVLQTDQQQTLNAVLCTRPKEQLNTTFTPIATPVTTHHLTCHALAYRPTTHIHLSSEPIIVSQFLKGTIVANRAGQQLVIRSRTSFPLDAQTTEVEVLSTETNQHYLVAKYADRFDLFSVVQPLRKLLANVEQVDSQRAVTGSILWYCAEPNQPAGYNLNTNAKQPLAAYGPRRTLLTQARSIKLSADYATVHTVGVTGSPANLPVDVLVTPGGTIRASVPGHIEVASANLTKIICRRGSELYVLTYQSTGRTYTSQLVSLPLTNYQESYFSPNGKFLMLKDKTQKYEIYNITTGTSSTFESGKFVAFDKSGSLIIEGDSPRSSRLLDPVTFEDITPLSYHHYRFLSPDGKLFAQSTHETKYYAGFLGRYITEDEKKELEKICSYNIDPKVQTEAGIKRSEEKKEFYAKNATYFASQGITTANKLWSRNVYKKHKRLQIGIVGTTTLTEISLPSNTEHFNYAAFSHDNLWITAVGKPVDPGCGFVTVVKLTFDPVALILAATSHFQEDCPEASHLNATWICGVSKTNQFATYTSNGNTYTLELSDNLLGPQPTRKETQANFVRHQNTVAASSGVWNCIPGKNYLCHSPSGRFMALSEERYHPISLGGTGHQASNAVHVLAVEGNNLVDSFRGHGEAIMNKKDRDKKMLIFVAFSEDEQSLMTMSKDGVVIVRRFAPTA